MKLKNVKVGDTLEVKSSIVDEPLNDKLSPDMLCEVTYVEPLHYEGELTVRVTSDDDDIEWVSHRHLRKPRPKLTGSDLARKMLERGDKYVMCLVFDDTRNLDVTYVIRGYHDGYFHTKRNSWENAVPINNQGEPLTAAEVGL